MRTATLDVTLAEFLADPFSVLDAAYEGGVDTFFLDLGDGGRPHPGFNGRWLVLSTPESIRALFSLPPEIAEGGAANRILFPALTLPRGSLYFDGEEHASRRRAVAAALRRAPADTIERLADEESAREIAKWSDGGEVILLHAMQRVTAALITRIVLPEADPGARAAIVRSLVALERADSNEVSRRAALAEMEAAISAEVRRAEDGRARSEVVLALLAAGSGADTIEEVGNLLIAGFGTSAIMLAWALCRIADAPERSSRLYADLVAGGRGEVAAVVEETLRQDALHPFAGARLLRAAVDLDGTNVSAGTLVCASYYLLQRRMGAASSPGARLPDAFGGGYRRCIGRWLAVQTMERILGVVVLGFSLELRADRGRPEYQGVWYGPRGGGLALVRPRSHCVEGALR